MTTTAIRMWLLSNVFGVAAADVLLRVRVEVRVRVRVIVMVRMRVRVG